MFVKKAPQRGFNRWSSRLGTWDFGLEVWGLKGRIAIRPYSYSFSHTVYLIDTNRNNSKPPGDHQGAFTLSATGTMTESGWLLTGITKLP